MCCWCIVVSDRIDEQDVQSDQPCYLSTAINDMNTLVSNSLATSSFSFLIIVSDWTQSKIEGEVVGGNQSTRRKPPTNFIIQCCIDYILPWAGFKLTTLVVICTDGIRTFFVVINPTTIHSRPRRPLRTKYNHIHVYIE